MNNSKYHPRKKGEPCVIPPTKDSSSDEDDELSLEKMWDTLILPSDENLKKMTEQEQEQFLTEQLEKIRLNKNMFDSLMNQNDTTCNKPSELLKQEINKLSGPSITKKEMFISDSLSNDESSIDSD